MEELIRTLVEPLVEHKEDVYIKRFDEDADGYIVYSVMVNKDDIGRIIGKRGSIAQAIRTICYAAATKNKQMVKINFDHF
ncbi:MAG: KH domain-containing protein [Bacilli bacterium]|nr:KH domain-containing protein [Bacilli bacterium]